MFAKHSMATAIALALASSHAAHAEQLLKPVSITATRTSTDTDNVAATVTVVDGRAIARRLPADETDLFKDEPDVALARDLRRFGATRINIRGIEDNRVAQMVDGVRLPDFYNSGGPTNFTMSAPLGTSLDFLKSAEILRGPASSLYGSDSIGGVVGYQTLAPSDLLGADKSWAGRYRIGHTGANHGLSQSLLGAWRSGAVEALFGYSHSAARQLDNAGSDHSSSPARSAPNPQDNSERGVLAKLFVRPAAGHRLGLTLEGREQETQVEVRRLTLALPKVSAMLGDDHTRRVRASVEWEHQPQGLFYRRLTARVHQQDSDTANHNRQSRSNTGASCSAVAGTGNNCTVEQTFLFSQTATGLGVQFESGLQSGGLEHFLTYGVDGARVRTDEQRDATVRNLNTGTSSKSLAGDSFPLRDFAIGRTDSIGLFVQDEISIANDALSITPGLRFDHRTLTPEVDALARQVLTAIGRTAVEKSASAFSPKLAALWRVTPSYSLYGQLAHGFRAPNYEEVNGAFRNLAQRYGSSPNPELRAETSNGVEVGLKLHSQGVRAQVALYDNRYRDFIENARLNCPADPRCIAGLASTFMYVNRARARIYGFDARIAADLTAGWNLDAALAYAHGQNESSARPLNSIEPLRAGFGLTHDAGAWGSSARLRLARAVTRTDNSNGVWFRPAGYGVTDLSAWWNPLKRVTLNASVNNLFDKKHWLWSDIRQADASNPAGVDFYTQAGRSLSVSIKFDL